MNTTRKGFLATLGALIAAPFVRKQESTPRPSDNVVQTIKWGESIVLKNRLSHEASVRSRFMAGYSTARSEYSDNVQIGA